MRAVTTSRLARLAVIASVGGSIVLGSASPAGGSGGNGGGNGGGVRVATTVGSCTLYRGQAGMGADCVRETGSTDTIITLLAGDPYPYCRWERYFDGMPGVGEPEIPAEEMTETFGEGAYYVVWTINGIDDCDTAPATPPDGEIELGYTLDWILEGDTVPTLTPNQQKVWRSANTAYPIGVLVNEPKAPRALVRTSMHLEPIDGGYRAETSVDGGRIDMWAEVVRTTFRVVDPSGREVYTCVVAGTLEQPGRCGYRYPRSTAAWGDDGRHTDDNLESLYVLHVTLTWQVSYRVDGGAPQQLGAPISVDAPYRMQRVWEIQTLNR